MKNNINFIDQIILHKFSKLKDLYHHLLSLKKDVFGDHERLLFIHNPADKEIVNFVQDLLNEIDIPEFFTVFRSDETIPPAKLDFIPSKTHCFNAYANLEIDSVGSISPCCQFSGDTGLNVNSVKIAQAFTSDCMVKLRHQLQNNEKPKSCKKCWDLEGIGATSMRQIAKNKFKDLYYSIDYTKNSVKNLKTLDLKMGNICNLSCRICNRNSSSSIAKLELKNKDISKTQYFETMNATQWSSSDFIYDQMLDLSDNIQYLDLYGGEPFMTKKHFTYLKELISRGQSKNIKIDYNSNGSFYSKSFFLLWNQFKEVKISFSIDNIGNKFDLERNGTSWQHVENNIKKFLKHRSNSFKIDIFPTISILNVFYLPEIIEWMDSIDCANSTINHFVNRPQCLSVENLTVHAHKLVIEKLSKHTNSKISLDPIITKLRQITPVESNPEFIKYMKKLDSQRNQNFSATHPEIALAMGYNS